MSCVSCILSGYSSVVKIYLVEKKHLLHWSPQFVCICSSIDFYGLIISVIWDNVAQYKRQRNPLFTSGRSAEITFLIPSMSHLLFYFFRNPWPTHNPRHPHTMVSQHQLRSQESTAEVVLYEASQESWYEHTESSLETCVTVPLSVLTGCVMVWFVRTNTTQNNCREQRKPLAQNRHDFRTITPFAAKAQPKT